MKPRIRMARYPDVFAMESALQEVIEASKDVFYFPPIQRPQIYNYLNFHIPRGELFIAISDEKLAGFSLMDASAYGWNDQYAYYVGVLVVRPSFQNLEIETPLIAAMANQANIDRTSLIVRQPPGLKCSIDMKAMADMGAIISNGCPVFRYGSELEKRNE